MLPVGTDNTPVYCCYLLTRTMSEGHLTFCLLLFPGAMASAVDMTTCDRTWHFLFALCHDRGLCVNIQTQAEVSISDFFFCTTSLGVLGAGAVKVSILGFITKTAFDRGMGCRFLFVNASCWRRQRIGLLLFTFPYEA